MAVDASQEIAALSAPSPDIHPSRPRPAFPRSPVARRPSPGTFINNPYSSRVYLCICADSSHTAPHVSASPSPITQRSRIHRVADVLFSKTPNLAYSTGAPCPQHPVGRISPTSSLPSLPTLGLLSVNPEPLPLSVSAQDSQPAGYTCCIASRSLVHFHTARPRACAVPSRLATSDPT